MDCLSDGEKTNSLERLGFRVFSFYLKISEFCVVNFDPISLHYPLVSPPPFTDPLLLLGRLGWIIELVAQVHHASGCLWRESKTPLF